jgi:hypothetical protein
MCGTNDVEQCNTSKGNFEFHFADMQTQIFLCATYKSKHSCRYCWCMTLTTYLVVTLPGLVSLTIILQILLF